MTKFTVAALLGTSLLGLHLSVAAAQASVVIKAATPESVTPLLKAAGYTVTLDRSGKSPFLKLEHTDDGSVFYIDFTNCNASSCDGAYANAIFDPKDFKSAPDLTLINAWNQEYFAQAYLDSGGKPNLVSAYSFVGGFTSANFLDWVRDFYSQLNDFYQTLNK